MAHLPDCGPYGSPNTYPAKPGRPVLQEMAEALDCQAQHNQWHRDHPGEPCPPVMFSGDSYEAMERGRNLMDFAGGGTVSPGDAFEFTKEK